MFGYTATMDHERDKAVPPEVIRHYQRYTLEQVAMLLNLSKHYLWQCVRASRDERLRKRYEISRAALANLPMDGWFQQGRRWVIIESDLLRQLRQ